MDVKNIITNGKIFIIIKNNNLSSFILNFILNLLFKKNNIKIIGRKFMSKIKHFFLSLISNLIFIFLISINLIPILLILITSILTGTKIRTMWMTPFYLFFGVLFIYSFKSQINLKKINQFLYGFLFLFFLSPLLYSYVSISQTDKRTDYPGREIAAKVQIIWSKDFENEIEFVTGDEWKAGNLSYHLESRPKWEGFTNNEILEKSSQFICVDEVCLGRY